MLKISSAPLRSCSSESTANVFVLTNELPNKKNLPFKLRLLTDHCNDQAHVRGVRAAGRRVMYLDLCLNSLPVTPVLID